MSDYRETFKRKEVKYRINSEQREAIEAAAAAHLALGRFGESKISSLYLDTPSRDIISRSLEKPLFKEKLRLRWYSDADPLDAEAIFLELKKKFKGIVYKRRVKLDARSAKELLACSGDCELAAAAEADVSVATQAQIIREMQAYIARFDDLRPSAIIKCDRKAYEEPELGDAGLRITFDSNLRASDLFTNEHDLQLLEPGESIMEIKCNRPYPEWLVKLLSSLRVYPRSFSKYGELHKKQVPQGAIIRKRG